VKTDKLDRLVVMLILFTTMADATRDVVVFVWDWWPRHTVKWLAFFPTQAFLLFYFVESWRDRIMITVTSFIVWRLTYEAFLQLTQTFGAN